MNEANPAQLVPYVTGGAFVLAFIFGAIGSKTNFCTMGAVSDWINMGDLSRMRMWLLAIAVDLPKSIYQAPNFTWLSYIVGGFLFGAFRAGVLGVEQGIVTGVAVSLALLVWRSSRPHIAVVGRIPGTEHFRNVERYGVETAPGLVALRVDESMS